MRIHGLAPGLNYGQQAFEGLKAFRMPGNPGGIALFRPDLFERAQYAFRPGGHVRTGVPCRRRSQRRLRPSA